MIQIHVIKFDKYVTVIFIMFIRSLCGDRLMAEYSFPSYALLEYQKLREKFDLNSE